MTVDPLTQDLRELLARVISSAQAAQVALADEHEAIVTQAVADMCVDATVAHQLVSRW